MPASIRKLLESDGEYKNVTKMESDGKRRTVTVPTNHVAGVVEVVGQLLEQDRNVGVVYLCHPGVQHVSKLKREGMCKPLVAPINRTELKGTNGHIGGFCGYRNIQMLCSWIVGTKSQGFEHFHGKIPTIFEIQEYIEHAWDLGINASGRVETGGIRGTRKYIGTPDVSTDFFENNIV